MKLYRYKKPITVVPGSDVQNAIDHFAMMTEIQQPPCEDDLEIIIPHKDFVKIFKFARDLYQFDKLNSDQVEIAVGVYAQSLGYTLTETEIINGITQWAERFYDSYDEDIENWLR